MKKMLKIGALLFALLATAVTVQAQKFGYVNSAAILAAMPEVKAAEANLDALQKQLQKKGQQKVEAFQQDYLAVQQKAERGELSPKQQEEEATRLKAAEQEIQKLEQDMVQQLQEKRDSELQPIYEKINNAIMEVAKENGFTMIFDQGVLLYSEDSLDVSSLVKTKLGIVEN